MKKQGFYEKAGFFCYKKVNILSQIIVQKKDG